MDLLAAEEADPDVDSAFCEEVRSRSDDLVAEGANDVPPTLVSAPRELVEDSGAPAALRDGYDRLTEASSDDDLDAALDEIGDVLGGCGVDLEG